MKIFYPLIFNFFIFNHLFSQSNFDISQIQFGINAGINISDFYNIPTYDGNGMVVERRIINHVISNRQGKTGYSFSFEGLYWLYPKLSFRSEITLFQTVFEFQNDLTTETLLGVEAVIDRKAGNFSYKNSYLQIPFLVNYSFGNKMKFTFGTGLYKSIVFNRSKKGFAEEYIYGEYIDNLGWQPYSEPIKNPLDQNSINIIPDQKSTGWMIQILIEKDISKNLIFSSGFRFQREIAPFHDFPLIEIQNLSVKGGLIFKIRKGKKLSEEIKS